MGQCRLDVRQSIGQISAKFMGCVSNKSPPECRLVLEELKPDRNVKNHIN